MKHAIVFCVLLLSVTLGLTYLIAPDDSLIRVAVHGPVEPQKTSPITCILTESEDGRKFMLWDNPNNKNRDWIEY